MSVAAANRPLLSELADKAGNCRVAVFRALNLGDMLCAIPALRARLPLAHITLIGLQSAEPVVRRFPHYVDELELFPGDPAFPEQPVRTELLAGFYRGMRARRFDLVIQMHGSGQQSNRIVQSMAPVRWAGFVPDMHSAEEGRLFPWPDHLHEVHRYLALLRFLGVDAADDRVEFPVTEEDRRQATDIAKQHNLQLKRTVFILPGARLASRRWPVERYAAVADALAGEGWQVALTGSYEERALLGQLQKAAHNGGRFVNLCGRTGLGALAALLQEGRLLICNDTGISHVAAGAGACSVVIASGSDVNRWRPLNRQRHTVLHVPMSCRPCAYESCPVGRSTASRRFGRISMGNRDSRGRRMRGGLMTCPIERVSLA